MWASAPEVRVVGRLSTIVGVFASLIAGGVIALGIGLYFYTADLPPIAQLKAFNPTSKAKAPLLPCDGVEQEITVLPKEELGQYAIAAVTAAEGRAQTRSPFVSVFFQADEPRVATYQVQLARALVCGPHGSTLKRQLKELRLANAISRKFGQQELLTIYLNRIYLGTDTYGIESGAEKYFGKPASKLTLEETALLVGMIQSPRFYSPQVHPDRAKQRRNLILDSMVVQGSIARSDADHAKAIPIQNLQ